MNERHYFLFILKNLDVYSRFKFKIQLLLITKN